MIRSRPEPMKKTYSAYLVDSGEETLTAQLTRPSPGPRPPPRSEPRPDLAATPRREFRPSPLRTLKQTVPARQPSRRIPASESGNGSVKWTTFRTRPGDGLMNVAYMVHGDIKYWREIAQDNRHLLGPNLEIPPRTRLRVRVREPAGLIRETEGQRYWIRKGDTLMHISQFLYSTTRYWRALFLRNMDRIRDPNRIPTGGYLDHIPRERLRPKLGNPARIPASRKQSSRGAPLKFSSPSSSSRRGVKIETR